MPASLTIKKGPNDARTILLALGVGNYNATIMIQYMFMSPSTTDPGMPSIILMTKHLQAGLRAAGARVPLDGQVDGTTARALITLVGPEWNHVSWYALFDAVLAAKRTRSLEQRSGEMSLGMIPDLPDIPPVVSWAAIAAAAYLYLRK